MSNEYEEKARAAKVSAMIAAIDAAALRIGRKPEQVLFSLKLYGNKEWTTVDRIAKLKTISSDVTREAVINHYQIVVDTLKAFE